MFLRTLLASGLGLLPTWLMASSPLPNVVLVVADDLGYGDLGCYGGKIAKTPHLDQLAADGIRFTNFYAGHGNCSPSRTALMTGRTPMRVGIRSAIPLGSPMHVARSEITIASLLKQIGYDTCHVGKWHLNGLFNDASQPQPGDHGFAYWFSTQNNALPNHQNPNNFVRNGEPVGATEGFAGQLVASEAIHWLDKVRDRSKSFFLYVCFHEPHEPITTDPKFSKQYPSDDPSYSAFYGNVAQMDDAFGRLMRALDEQGLRDNTFVLFTSDNGPAVTRQHPHGSAGLLRDKKGSLWEGGIRVPGILRWPGHVTAGSKCDEAVCGVDLLPTVCSLAGATIPSDRKIDGASFLPALDGQPLTRSSPLYWHYPSANGEPKVALRIGDWKILATFDADYNAAPASITQETEKHIKQAKLDRFFLYNLARDPSETTDLAAAEPEKLNELRSAIQAKYDEVQFETPVWPYWKNSNAEGELIVWPSYVKNPRAK